MKRTPRSKKLVQSATEKTRSRVTLEKKHGYTVAVGKGEITQAQVREVLDEFP